MTDVSQEPYGDDGDARPVSLIGTRIPAPSPQQDSTTRDPASPSTATSGSPPTPRSTSMAGTGEDTQTGRVTRRLRRRLRGAPSESVPAGGDDPRQDEAFMLQDAGSPATPPTVTLSDPEEPAAPAPVTVNASATLDALDPPPTTPEADGAAGNLPAQPVGDPAVTTGDAANAGPGVDEQQTDAGRPGAAQAADARTPVVPPTTEPTGAPTTGSAGTRASHGRPKAVHHSGVPGGRTAPATDGAEASGPTTRETGPGESAPGSDYAPAVRPFVTGSGSRPTAAARPSGRPSVHAPRMAVVPPLTAKPSAPAQPAAQPSAQSAAISTAPPAGALESPPAGPSGSALPSAPGEPEPAATSRPSAPLPAVREPRSSRELWPWQEPWRDVNDLEPWEEIPIRESLADRVAAPLEGSWRIAVTSLIRGSGRTTVTAMLGMTLANIRAEPVVALDISGDLERTETIGDLDTDAGFSASLAERVGVRPSATLSDLVADSISYRARRGGTPRPAREIRWLISGDAGGTSTPVAAAGGLDVLPAYRPTGVHHPTGAYHPAGQAASGGPGATGPSGAVAVPFSDTKTQPAPLVAAGMPGPPTPQVLAAGLRTLEQAYPLVLVDTPLDWDTQFASITLRDADVILLVVPALPSDLAEASAALRDTTSLRARRAGPPPMVIVAAMSVRRGRWSPQTRSAAAKLARRVDAMVRIPYDMRLDDEVPDHTRTGRRHSAGAAPGSRTPIAFSRLRWRSRRAFLRLAATIVDACGDLGNADLESGESDDTTVAAIVTSEDHSLIPGV
ncbi:MinD/ParA family ATP-binding protein [Candidatus Protofrankia californiensis]|uniref:MinD/ParA family ATP-binding protein n=1 Tax=Candidatus Protofrankia californiensis TaxID=1839754 RepID=UPI0010415CBD|nr:hypothetical protein [Candidatus Protofrankia californiensis]